MLGRIFTNVASKVATKKKKKKKKEGEEEGITSDHLLEFASSIVAGSNITPRVPTDFCSGRKFPDGTECMCATYLKNVDDAAAGAAAAVEGNLEEEFMRGHATRENLRVSYSKCKECPATELPPKKKKKKEEKKKEKKRRKRKKKRNDSVLVSRASRVACRRKRKKSTDMAPQARVRSATVCTTISLQ